MSHFKNTHEKKRFLAIPARGHHVGIDMKLLITDKRDRSTSFTILKLATDLSLNQTFCSKQIQTQSSHIDHYSVNSFHLTHLFLITGKGKGPRQTPKKADQTDQAKQEPVWPGHGSRSKRSLSGD